MQLKTFEPVEDKATGRITGYAFNNLAFAVKPFYLGVDNSANNALNPEQLNMLANANSPHAPVASHEEGAIEVKALSCERLAACLVDIVDDNRKHRITGRPCHVDTIFGDGMEPFVLPESLFLGRNDEIQFLATDLSGFANDIRPYFIGQKIITERARHAAVDRYVVDRMVRSRYMLPYLCPLDEDPTLTALQERDYYFTEDTRGHFEVRKLTYVSTGDFKFKVRDETGQNLTSNWVESTAGLGTAREPLILPTPWVIKAGGTVTWTFRDLSGYPNTIYLTLSGRMLFTDRR